MSIAVLDGANSLWYSSYAPGSGFSCCSPILTSQTFQGTPAIVVAQDGNAYIAVRDNSGVVGIAQVLTGSGNYATWRSGGSSFSSDPSVAAGGSTLYLSEVSGSNDLYYSTFSISTLSWSTWTDTGNFAVSGSIVFQGGDPIVATRIPEGCPFDHSLVCNLAAWYIPATTGGFGEAVPGGYNGAGEDGSGVGCHTSLCMPGPVHVPQVVASSVQSASAPAYWSQIPMPIQLGDFNANSWPAVWRSFAPTPTSPVVYNLPPGQAGASVQDVCALPSGPQDYWFAPFSWIPTSPWTNPGPGAGSQTSYLGGTMPQRQFGFGYANQSNVISSVLGVKVQVSFNHLSSSDYTADRGSMLLDRSLFFGSSPCFSGGFEIGFAEETPAPTNTIADRYNVVEPYFYWTGDHANCGFPQDPLLMPQNNLACSNGTSNSSSIVFVNDGNDTPLYLPPIYSGDDYTFAFWIYYDTSAQRFNFWVEMWDLTSNTKLFSQPTGLAETANFPFAQAFQALGSAATGATGYATSKLGLQQSSPSSGAAGLTIEEVWVGTNIPRPPLGRASGAGIFRSSAVMTAEDVNGNLAWDPGVDRAYFFGSAGDIPILGDWNGTGQDCVGIFRPSVAMFALDTNCNGQWDPGVDSFGFFGQTGDQPIVGDWTGDGKSKIGIYRPSTSLFALDINNNLTWDPGIDAAGNFGQSGDIPIVGNWTADGKYGSEQEFDWLQ